MFEQQIKEDLIVYYEIDHNLLGDVSRKFVTEVSRFSFRTRHEAIDALVAWLQAKENIDLLRHDSVNERRHPVLEFKTGSPTIHEHVDGVTVLWPILQRKKRLLDSVQETVTVDGNVYTRYKEVVKEEASDWEPAIISGNWWRDPDKQDSLNDEFRVYERKIVWWPDKSAT